MPYKDKQVKKEYHKLYGQKNRDSILAHKKEYHSRAEVKKRVAEFQNKYRKTPKGRFLHTAGSKYISFEDYLILEKKHKGLCSICKKQCSSGKKLSIDHCHKTNKVRGLLCSNCNLGIGKFYDNPLLLKRAVSYLKKYETK